MQSNNIIYILLGRVHKHQPAPFRSFSAVCSLCRRRRQNELWPKFKMLLTASICYNPLILDSQNHRHHHLPSLNLIFPHIIQPKTLTVQAQSHGRKHKLNACARMLHCRNSNIRALILAKRWTEAEVESKLVLPRRASPPGHRFPSTSETATHTTGESVITPTALLGESWRISELENSELGVP